MGKQLIEKDRQELNKLLRELQAHNEDIDKAIRAKVPGMDQIKDHCTECIERVNLLKQEYFGDKR